jgi:hypothetical protein
MVTFRVDLNSDELEQIKQPLVVFLNSVTKENAFELGLTLKHMTLMELKAPWLWELVLQ